MPIAVYTTRPVLNLESTELNPRSPCASPSASPPQGTVSSKFPLLYWGTGLDDSTNYLRVSVPSIEYHSIPTILFCSRVDSFLFIYCFFTKNFDLFFILFSYFFLSFFWYFYFFNKFKLIIYLIGKFILIAVNNFTNLLIIT
jgi:hypothetical protein